MKHEKYHVNSGAYLSGYLLLSHLFDYIANFMRKFWTGEVVIE